MCAWLISLTSACYSQIDLAGANLNTAKNKYMTWNDDYYQKAQQLSDQQQYKGQAATAFLEAVNTDINDSRTVYDGLGHVGSACANLAMVMYTSGATHDGKMAAMSPPAPPYGYKWDIPQYVFGNWREQLIQLTLTNIDTRGTDTDIINTVLESGQGSIIIPYASAYQTVEQQVVQDATTYTQQYIASDQSLHLPAYLDPQKDPDIANNPDLKQQSIVTQRGLQQDIAQVQQGIYNYYLSAFDQLATEVETDLTSWATDISNEYQNFLSTVQNSEGYLTARDLFDYIGTDVDATQSTSNPITITPYKNGNKTGLLITIAGTDMGHVGYDTSIFTALQTGQGFDNAYKDDVKRAIQAYMSEHPDMRGSEVTLAGYSLGGMTAQQVAQDITGGQDPNLNPYNFQVAQVITYGSPVMGPPANNVQYNMYDATYDPVPLLSSYENPILGQLDSPLNPHPSILSFLPDPNFGTKLEAAVLTIGQAELAPWDVKLHSYIDPKGQYGSHIHNINDVGNTVQGTGNPPVFVNHMQYQDSNQLNAASTATTDINVASLGPTEYFGMKNTNNFYAKNVAPLPSLLSGIEEAVKYSIIGQ